MYSCGRENSVDMRTSVILFRKCYPKQYHLSVCQQSSCKTNRHWNKNMVHFKRPDGFNAIF